MEIDREVKSPQDQFVEKLNNTSKPRNDEEACNRQLGFEQDHQRRLAELDVEDREQSILTKQREFYERVLQLGNHEVAVELLLEITRNIATERNRSANRVGGV